MIFNVATVNYDDHLKNFAFLMNDAGAWRMSPAYDVSFAESDAWTWPHQLSVAGKFRGVTREDCLRVASAFDIRGPQASQIIGEVLEAVTQRDEEAKTVGIDPDFRTRMSDRLARECACSVDESARLGSPGRPPGAQARSWRWALITQPVRGV